MVDKIFILKSINDAITTKCPTSSQARKRGMNAQISDSYDENTFDAVQEYIYPDGTIISFSHEKGLYNVVVDGKVYDFPGKREGIDTEYKMFNYLTQQLRGMQGILGYSDMYTFVCKYMDDFASYVGMGLNRAMRQGSDLEMVLGIHNWNDVILDGHDTIIELENTLPIDKEDYSCMRVQSNLNHKSDSIDKKFVSDKAHSCNTVGGDWEEQIGTFGTGDTSDSWKIITIIDKDSGATGLFAGNSIVEERGSDWEAELQFAPKQRFERLLIDEKNKFIIQKPVIKNK